MRPRGRLKVGERPGWSAERTYPCPPRGTSSGFSPPPYLWLFVPPCGRSVRAPLPGRPRVAQDRRLASPVVDAVLEVPLDRRDRAVGVPGDDDPDVVDEVATRPVEEHEVAHLGRRVPRPPVGHRLRLRDDRRRVAHPVARGQAGLYETGVRERTAPERGARTGLQVDRAAPLVDEGAAVDVRLAGL